MCSSDLMPPMARDGQPGQMQQGMQPPMQPGGQAPHGVVAHPIGEDAPQNSASFLEKYQYAPPEQHDEAAAQADQAGHHALAAAHRNLKTFKQTGANNFLAAINGNLQSHHAQLSGALPPGQEHPAPDGQPGAPGHEQPGGGQPPGPGEHVQHEGADRQDQSQAGPGNPKLQSFSEFKGEGKGAEPQEGDQTSEGKPPFQKKNPQEGQPEDEEGKSPFQKKIQKAFSGISDMEDYLQKAGTPIGGLTPGGYRKIAEGEYRKEDGKSQPQAAQPKSSFGKSQDAFQALQSFITESEKIMRKGEMPEGDAKFPQTESAGGSLKETPEVTGLGKSKPQSGTTAEGGIEGIEKLSGEDPINGDEEETEKQLKPHKKPIENATEKSLFPASQRDMAAKQRAQKISELQKSQDVTLHPYQRMHKGTEEAVDHLLKSQDSKMADFPELNPNIPLVAQGMLCKSCHCRHTAALTVCPRCGIGASTAEVLPGVKLTETTSLKKAQTFLRPARREPDSVFVDGKIPLEE